MKSEDILMQVRLRVKFFFFFFFKRRFDWFMKNVWVSFWVICEYVLGNWWRFFWVIEDWEELLWIDWRNWWSMKRPDHRWRRLGINDEVCAGSRMMKILYLWFKEVKFRSIGCSGCDEHLQVTQWSVVVDSVIKNACLERKSSVPLIKSSTQIWWLYIDAEMESTQQLSLEENCTSRWLNPYPYWTTVSWFGHGKWSWINLGAVQKSLFPEHWDSNLGETTTGFDKTPINKPEIQTLK